MMIMMTITKTEIIKTITIVMTITARFATNVCLKSSVLLKTNAT